MKILYKTGKYFNGKKMENVKKLKWKKNLDK